MPEKELALNLNSDRKLVAREKACERLLEIAVRAPQAAKKVERIPLNLALVIDRSGSMSGGKLEAVKEAALHVLDLLGSQDRVAIVCYDDHINVLAPSTLVTEANRNHLKDCIRPLRTGGSTALHEGWLTGCRQLAEFIQPKTLNRCLLLTDGLANVGLTDTEQIAVQSRDLLDRQVSTSTFGVGHGFNEHLLEAMANQGGGNFYFIETPGDIAGIFESEFKDLADITARDVEVNLEFDPAISTQVLGGWRTDCPARGQLRLSLGSLGSGQERVAYLKMTIPAAAEGKEEVLVKATVLGKGEKADLLEARSELRWRYVSQSEAEAEQPDQAFMERYAPVQLAEDATAALKLEREGRRQEAEQRLKGTLEGTRAYVSHLQADYYDAMSIRMARGMDEADRKRSHYQAYMEKQTRVRGERFRLERPTRHLVIDVEGVKVLLDTGSPMSIGRLNGWTFLGQPVNLLPEFQAFNLEYLAQQAGIRVEVLLGMDVLKDYDVLIDDRTREVVFSREIIRMPYQIRLPLKKYLMNVPALRVEVDGQPISLVLDTGARYSFLPKTMLEGRQATGTEHDFYPGYGEFETPVYPVEMRLDGERFTASCGILPGMLELALKVSGMVGILGMDLLDYFQMHLSLSEGKLFLTRYPDVK